MNPLKVSRSKAKEQIGERLQQQYANARSTSAARPLKYRKTLDPTVEDVRNLCLQLRRQARNDRILLHYNGHGVPRPTDHGEIWVFDKNHTEYIPLSVTDLRQWMGKPSIVVLDCSAAGVLLPYLTSALNGDTTAAPGSSQQGHPSEDNDPSLLTPDERGWVRDTIVLAPCTQNEQLPMDPDYPADIFTSCLTTPIRMALRWFVRRNPASTMGLAPDATDAIPGKATDRKTPLGELNWIFTAVTDSIAWNVLPKYLFQRLFRQDLLVASMFRNFLLADRILRHLGCTPVSYPPLPPTADHPLWQSWDFACETLLYQLMKDGVLPTNTPPRGPGSSEDRHEECDSTAVVEQPATAQTEVTQASTVSSPFFSEQLTAFEVWLDFSSIHKTHLASGALQNSSPEQLPVVLQVLLFQVHRIRALMLLRRFLDLGPWAVNLSLCLGIFPYVMKLLQSPQYKSLLVSIWASILAFDPSCRVDLLKDGAFHHFVQHLMWGLNSDVVDVAEAARERALAAFILCNASHRYPAGQVECVRLNLHGSCCALLSSYEQGEHTQDGGTVELHLPSHLRLWLVLCLASMVVDNVPNQIEAYSAGVHLRLAVRMNHDQNVNVRTAVCYALGCLVGSQPKKGSRPTSQQDLHAVLRQPARPQQPPFAQGLVAPTQLVLPQAVAANQLTQTQLQPTFAGAPVVTNLPLGSQQLQPLRGGPIQRNVATGGAIQVPATFLSQPVPLRTTAQGTPIQASYILPTGQPLAPGQPGIGGPPGFMVGSVPLVGQSASLMDPNASFQTHMPEPQSPSVFEDRQRLELDLYCINLLLKGTSDASVLVRYEAVVGLACAVGKYLEAFIVIAGETSSVEQISASGQLHLEENIMDKFREAWGTVRSLQKEDVFPSVRKAANDIVLVVNEHLLQTMSDGDQEAAARAMEGSSVHGMKEFSKLAGIDEDREVAATTGHPKRNRVVRDTNPQKLDLRRVSSEFVSPHSEGSMERNAQISASSHQSLGVDSKDTDKLTYTFPKSEFYEWQKKCFDHNFSSTESEALEDDPLSPSGAAKLYQDRRNSSIKKTAQELLQRFQVLAPNPPETTKKGIQLILNGEEDEEAALAAEELSNSKKRELELKESQLLSNDSGKMTSMVRFHPFQDYLVSCDESRTVSSWDATTGKCLSTFNNGNPEGTRMTTACWINESYQSLLLVGSDDGAVRLWRNLAEPPGKASIVSAFNALPMTTGERRSGLVCEWQPFSGTLIAAGSSKYFRCWDFDSEKMSFQIETDTDAHITTLTTAWEYDEDGSRRASQRTAGGPDIVVAGQSDGALRIFDIRSNRAGLDLRNKPSKTKRYGPRATQYSEHKSWVVATAYTSYSDKSEIVSGTLSGEIKTWDLRMSSSIRTIEAQRSTMTALAFHPKIPITATGSHAQFMKVLTPDGDTLQVLRYHEKMANHRIGPVSCVAFHPFKPMLAAGATDSFIGLYEPKKKLF